MEQPTCFGSQLSSHCQECEFVDECENKRMEGYLQIIPKYESGLATLNQDEKLWLESDKESELIKMPEEHQIKRLNGALIDDVVQSIIENRALSKTITCYFNREKQ